MNCKRIRVSGQVQGVGFRMYVQGLAENAGILGEVWNCEDGSVEMVACHSENLYLMGFVAGLYQGPGDVQSVNWVPEEETCHYERFRIASTR